MDLPPEPRLEVYGYLYPLVTRRPPFDKADMFYCDIDRAITQVCRFIRKESSPVIQLPPFTLVLRLVKHGKHRDRSCVPSYLAVE